MTDTTDTTELPTAVEIDARYDLQREIDAYFYGRVDGLPIEAERPVRQDDFRRAVYAAKASVLEFRRIYNELDDTVTTTEGELS